MPSAKTPPPRSRRSLPRWSWALALACASVASSAVASAEEPWADKDPPSPWNRYAVGDFGFRAGAEYRAQWMTVNPIALNSTTARHVSWLEHRLRVDASVDYLDKVRAVLSVDVLDGVLWGDNGELTTEPEPNSGINIGTKSPNVTRPCLGYQGGDLLDAESYAYTLCSADPLRVRKLYGEVTLPFGLLRIGRQPVNIGMGVQSSDGEGRPNRFGISRTGNLADRIIFGTKPLEAFKPVAERNTSADEGLIVAVGYDRLVGDSVHLFGDDVNQFDSAIRFLAPKHALGTDLLVAGYFVHRWDAQYKTRLNSGGVRAMSRFGGLYAGFDMAANLGSSREISEAYKLITSDPAVEQDIQQLGARAVVRYDFAPRRGDYNKAVVSAYLEGDYASGDGDPNVRTPLTQFVFSEETNVGLLMFEHVLAFQSARASAAGVEVLRRLGATSFPAEAVSTRGSFTNAVAIFPQVDVRPTEELLLRGGVLMAWAPEPLIDPVASLQARDGLSIDDDLVNFVGGKPGTYYGTELDLRVQYRFVEHFIADIEGALLFPGDAFQDENGSAVRSGLLQGRTTFYF